MSEDVLVTALIGAIGWLIKEIVFRGLESSRAAARAEWERQLRDVWSPLYVNLILLFESDGDKAAAGYMTRIEAVLEKNVNLVEQHYLGRLGRVLSYFKGHSQPKFSKEEVLSITRHCYERVQELNFVLYKDEPAYQIDGRLHPLVWYFIIFRYLVRALWHFTVWAAIAIFVLFIFDFPVKVPDRFLNVVLSTFFIAIVLDFGRLRLAYMAVHKKVRKRLFE